MTATISFNPYLGWVNTTDPNSIPEDVRVLTAEDLMRYENFASQAAALLNQVFVQSPELTAPVPTGTDTANLSAHFTAFAGKTITLRPGVVYTCTTELPAITADNTIVDLNGSTIDFSTMSPATALGQKFGIRANGTLGTPVAGSVAITKWSKTITGLASTAGLMVGDTVRIMNDERPVLGMTRTDRSKGELNTIAAIPNGTSVTLVAGALFDYGTTGLTVTKITPVKNVVIKNGKIIMGGVNSAHNGIQFEYGRDVTVENVFIEGAEDCSIGLKAVIHGKVINSGAKNATSQAPGPAGLGETGYGVCVWDASRHIKIHGNDFENNRHHVAGGGYLPPAYVKVSNNNGRQSLSASYDCHEPCIYWNFFKNTAEIGTHGFFIRGQYITLEGNDVSDISQEAYGIHAWDGVLEQRGIRLIGNRANHCSYGISVGKASGGAEFVSYDIEIIENRLEDCGTNPIRLRLPDGGKVERNVIVGGLADAILIEGINVAGTITNAKNLSVQGNQIRGHGSYGIHLKYFDTALVTGSVITGGTAEGIYCEGDATTRSKNLMLGINSITSVGANGTMVRYTDDINATGGMTMTPGGHGYYFLGCNRIDLNNVTVRAHVGLYGILIDGGAGHFVNNVRVSGSTTANSDALRVQNVTGIVVNGGYLAAIRYGIYTTTTTPLTVHDCKVSETGHGTKIQTDAAVQSLVDNT